MLRVAWCSFALVLIAGGCAEGGTLEDGGGPAAGGAGPSSGGGGDGTGANGTGANGTGANGPSTGGAAQGGSAGDGGAPSVGGSPGEGGSPPLTCVFAAPEDCAGAEILSAVAGDEGSDTVVRSGDEARWFKVHIQEADSGISEADLSYRVTLASPPGMNYDLRVYQGSQDGPANCNGTLKVGAGTPETVSDSWDDDQGFGGEDDSVWLVIEVVYVSGDLCGVDNQWTLTVAGNT
ncbi:MAG: hypothetical protein IPM79_31000 [Polyangiaceae bacterium]|jgi:hypothetical protein|nr:hypothetical protein [Polyangiaceae bacterium]MBK8941913.1 hypothetical protein [Polyangiaceae bacterium]